MSDYLLYNGKFYHSHEPLVTAGNRGLRYGDGLFETLKVSGATIHFKDWHFERLLHGLQLLGFELPAHFTMEKLAEQVIALCKKNKHAQARVRINLVRGNGGIYDPENHFPHSIIESWALPQAGFELNSNGLLTGIYRDAPKATGIFSNIKSNNYLPYTMAALHAKKQRWNDVLVLNTAGRICDASIANLFIVKDGHLLTPALGEGCVAGIMRKHLLHALPLHGITVQEGQVTVDQLLAADEVFLTNVIKGIRWVGQCADSRYNNQMSNQIFTMLLKK